MTFPKACGLVFHITAMASMHCTKTNPTTRGEMQISHTNVSIPYTHFVVSAYDNNSCNLNLTSTKKNTLDEIYRRRHKVSVDLLDKRLH